MKTILEKEKIIKKLNSQLGPCTNGKCPITRRGEIHKNFHFHDELKIKYFPLVILLTITGGLAIFSTINYNDNRDLAIIVSFFISTPIGLVAILLSKMLDTKGKKHDRWFSLKENSVNYYHKKDWKKAIDNAKYALEIKDDSQTLLLISSSLYELEKYSDAIIYFEKLLELEPQNADAHNVILCYQKLGMHDEVIFYINKILDRDVNVNILNNIGRVCLDEYDLEGALYFFEQSIEIDPTDPVFWTNKGMVYNDFGMHYKNIEKHSESKKEFEQAIKCFDQSLLLDPSYKYAYAHKSVALHGLEKYDEIFILLETFFEISPLDIQTSNDRDQFVMIQHLAVAFGKTEQLEGALKYYNKYLAVVPHDKLALRAKADTLLSLSRFTEALSIYEEYLKLEPYDAEALNNKIHCLIETKQIVRALICANILLRLFPKFSGIYYNLGLFFLKPPQSQFEIAQQFFEMALQDSSEDILSMQFRAYSYKHLNRYSDEIRIYQKILAITPNNVQILKELAIAFDKIQNYSDAIRTYERILELVPTNNFALASKGQSLTMMNRHAEALNIYDEFLKKNPNDPIILENKGVSLVGIGKFKRSLKYFEKSLEINPISYIALYGKGQALNGLRRYEEAIELFDEAIDQEPNFYGSYLEIGIAYYFSDNLEKGIENFSKSLEINPYNPNSLYNISNAYFLTYQKKGGVLNILNSIKYFNEFYRTGAPVPYSRRFNTSL